MNKSWMAVANQYYVVYYGVPEMKIKAFRVFRDVGMKKATDVEINGDLRTGPLF